MPYFTRLKEIDYEGFEPTTAAKLGSYFYTVQKGRYGKKENYTVQIPRAAPSRLTIWQTIFNMGK
jgi:hypothetical protein